MTTVVIPARSGSKGLPGKNLAVVGGIPLVARAVRAASLGLRSAGLAGRVICSTDSDEIAAVAREWGAEVPFLRPAALAGDETPMIDVLLDVADRLALSEASTLALVQPTSPLVVPGDIATALELHRGSGATVVGVADDTHPSGWAFGLTPEGRLVARDGRDAEPVATRRQDVPSGVRICGAVYVATVSSLRRHRSFLQPGTLGLRIPAGRAVDVDTETDLEIARGLVARRAIAPVTVGPLTLGPGHRPRIIAEAGVNHNGDLELAMRLVDAALAAGADAVKFQTFRSRSVISPRAEQAAYQRRNSGVSESQLEMVERLELTVDQTRRLAGHCRERGILFLSSPFDEDSAGLLASLGVPAFKIGSGEITNHPFLATLAQYRLPLLVSTGMATLSEVAAALDVIDADGSPPVVLLHCVSSYPAPPEEANLSAMTTLREAFSVPVGWSDHTLGSHVSIAAVAAGACVVEKHFTLDRGLPGPDHAASLEPAELEGLVRGSYEAWAARGDGVKRCMPCEVDTRRVARRSLFAARDLEAGETLTSAGVVALRPGTGIPPSRWSDLAGRAVARPIAAGAMLEDDDIG